MRSFGDKRNYYNDDAAAFDRSGAVMPDPRIFGLAHATADDDESQVVMPYRSNFAHGRATVVDGSGVVTRDPSNFDLEPATTPAVPEEGGDGEEEGEGELDEKKRFKNFPWYATIWGWVLLAVQGLVMGILYLDGGGRVVEVKYQVDNTTTPARVIWDDAECSTAQGPPYLAEAVLLRAVTAVVAQLITFCASDLGLLKPFEAMWVVFGYVIHFLGLGMACCCGIMATLPTYEVTTTYSDGSRSTSTETPGLCACLCIVFVWIGIPATLIWNFTFRVAQFNLLAVCDLVLDGDAIFWFQMGSLVFLMVGIVVISCCNSSWKTGSIIPFARAFLVVDSLTIGATAVWGNYVQSGAVAGMFALLPLFNFFVSWLELCR